MLVSLYSGNIPAFGLLLLLLVSAEWTRRLARAKSASINSPFVPDAQYKRLKLHINILHLTSILLWFLSLSPLLLIPSVLGTARHYLAAQVRVAAMMTAAFW